MSIQPMCGKRTNTLWLAVILLLGSCALFGGGLAACAQGHGSASDPASVKEHARQILAQPEFQPESADNPLARMGRSLRERWDRIARWMGERWNAIQKWFGRLFSGPGGQVGAAAGTAGRVVAYVFGALFLGLVGWLVAKLIGNLAIEKRERQAKSRTAYDEAEADDAVPLEPNAWLQQANGFAGSDDYRRAFRAVFIAILLLLDEGGLIEFDRSRTNGDYLRLLRRKNARAYIEIMDPLVLEFDRRWYGRAETDAEDFRRVQQTFERVRGLMSAPATGATPVPASGKV